MFAADLYDDLDGQLEEQGLMCECLGGGKIFHDSTKKEIEVMGQSQVTVTLIKSSSKSFLGL